MVRIIIRDKGRRTRGSALNDVVALNPNTNLGVAFVIVLMGQGFVAIYCRGECDNTCDGVGSFLDVVEIPLEEEGQLADSSPRLHALYASPLSCII